MNRQSLTDAVTLVEIALGVSPRDMPARGDELGGLLAGWHVLVQRLTGLAGGMCSEQVQPMEKRIAAELTQLRGDLVRVETVLEHEESSAELSQVRQNILDVDVAADLLHARSVPQRRAPVA